MDGAAPVQLEAAVRPSPERRLLGPAVLLCLVRAIALTSAAGYSLGQELGNHGGPPLVDDFELVANLALFTTLAAVTWLELGLLQTRPRAGLAVTAVWGLGVLVLGVQLARKDTAFWLLPAVVLAVPPLAAVLSPAAWRLAPRPWGRPGVRRLLWLLLVHATGTAALVGVWSERMATSAAAQWAATAVVLVAWSLFATCRVRATIRGRVMPPSDLYVTMQVALVVGLSVLSWSVVS